MTGLKKNLLSLPYNTKKNMVELSNNKISISRQTKLLNISRSFLYYTEKTNNKDEKIM
ncbi:hypothetical protein HOG21_02815 [bacterium]|nr:hypothetical protein [bacterium]